MFLEQQLQIFIHSLNKAAIYSGNTITAYRNDINKFIKYLNSSFQTQQNAVSLNPKLIARFLKHEHALGVKPSTVYRRRASIRKFSEFINRSNSSEIANDQKMDSILAAEERRSVSQGGDMLTLSEEQLNSFKATISQFHNPRAKRDSAIVHLLLELGVSISELLNVNLSDFDRQRKMILINRNHIEVNQFFIPTSAAVIQDYIETAWLDLSQNVNETALFVSQMGGRISRQNVWQGIRNWGKLAGISIDLSPRIIRNTAVSTMLKAGLKIEEIQYRLGHSNIFSTKTLLRRLNRSTC